mgnify:CR=1 FL=1
MCKLNTRTTVLAATNPKGKYDPEQALTINIAVASPLLSRFDLVMVLLDTQNAEWDKIVSSFILGLQNHPVLENPIASAQWSLDKLQVQRPARKKEEEEEERRRRKEKKKEKKKKRKTIQ